MRNVEEQETKPKRYTKHTTFNTQSGQPAQPAQHSGHKKTHTGPKWGIIYFIQYIIQVCIMIEANGRHKWLIQFDVFLTLAAVWLPS